MTTVKPARSRTRAGHVFDRVVHSIVFRPVTSVYAMSAALATTVAGHLLRADVAIALLTMAVVAVLVIATRQDVEKIRVLNTEIHDLVNSQHEEMVRTITRMSARIDQLLNAMRAANVTIPYPEAKEDR